MISFGILWYLVSNYDFLYPESKIGDFKLCLDSISGDFISQNNPELRYAKEIVIEDPHFLIFKENLIRDEDGEFILLDFSHNRFPSW